MANRTDMQKLSIQEISRRVKKATLKRLARNARQDFMLTLFEKPDGNKKEMNGFILEKWFDNNTHRWLVSIYTLESFKKKWEWQENQSKLNI